MLGQELRSSTLDRLLDEEEELLREALDKTSEERRRGRLQVASGGCRPMHRPPTPLNRGRPVPTPSPTLPPVEYVRRHGDKGASAFSRSADPNASPLGLPPPPMGSWGLTPEQARYQAADDARAAAVAAVAVAPSSLVRELDYMQSVEHADGTALSDGVIRSAQVEMTGAFVTTDARLAAHEKVTAMKREGVAQIVRGDYDAAVATFKAALAHDPNQGELGVGFEQPIQDFLDPWMISELKTGLRRAEHMAARKSFIDAERAAVLERQRKKAERLAELGRRKGKHWLARAEAEADAGAIRRAEEAKERARQEEAAKAVEEEEAQAIVRRKELAAAKVKAAAAKSQAEFEVREGARATAKRLREEGEKALRNDEYDRGYAMLEECLAPRLAEARQSISVDFDARVHYAIKEAKARQKSQREEREAHDRRRAAIETQAVLDRELAKQKEIERRYGATRRRRAIATERLGRVFAVQEHAAAGGVISPMKESKSNQRGAYSAIGGIGAPDAAAEMNRRLLAPAMAAQSRDRISGRPDSPLRGTAGGATGAAAGSSSGSGSDGGGAAAAAAAARRPQDRPGSGYMGRGVAAAGGGVASGSAAYDAAAAYLASRVKEGSWR
jgi:hypothetical protein